MGKNYLINNNYLDCFLFVSNENLRCTNAIVSGNRKCTFLGQAMLDTGNKYKVFDLDRGYVLSIYNNELFERNYLQAISLLQTVYRTAFFEKNEYGIVEKYIKSRNLFDATVTEKQEIYYEVLQNTNMNLKLLYKNENRILQEDMIFFKQKGANELYSWFALLEYGMEDVPFSFQHGDLHFGNILKENKTVYIIDFDVAGNHCFLVDIFKIIYMDFFETNNTDFTRIIRCDDKKYIKVLSDCFSAVGKTFIKEKMIQYINVFIFYHAFYKFEKNVDEKTILKEAKLFQNACNDVLSKHKVC